MWLFGILTKRSENVKQLYKYFKKKCFCLKVRLNKKNTKLFRIVPLLGVKIIKIVSEIENLNFLYNILFLILKLFSKLYLFVSY